MNAQTLTKADLFAAGLDRILAFGKANAFQTLPEVHVIAREDWYFAACAYYRPTFINICLEKCAHIGTAGMAWSYPGYSVDRTPFGVLAHELGHHADVSRSLRPRGYFGEFSVAVRRESGEERLTSYCPNDAEWFAEMFRLFVTNPDLLKILRPRTYAILRAEGFSPVEGRTWEEVLKDAPERTRIAAGRKVVEARK